MNFSKTILFLFICYYRLNASVAIVACPFSQTLDCKCSGDTIAATTTFEWASCKIGFGDEIKFNTTPPNTYVIEGEFVLRGYVANVGPNAFTSFRSIGHLNVIQAPTGYTFNWHPLVLTTELGSVFVANFSVANSSGPAPPTLTALGKLGKNGLVGLRVINCRTPNPVSLPNNAFAGFRKLTSLIFDRTPIDFVGDSAFAGLEDTLVELVIKRATLTDFPKAIRVLTKLKYLDLSDNAILFPSVAFSAFSNLEELRVSGNYLQPSIDAGAFKRTPPNLRSLYMDHCALKNIPRTVLVDSPQVTDVSLADNQFWILRNDRDFPLNTNLTYLNLDGNPICTVNIDALKPLGNVRTLSLRRTTIASLGLWLLNGMNQLKYFDMDRSDYLQYFTGANPPYTAPANLTRVMFANTVLNSLPVDFDIIINRTDFEVLDFSNNTNLLCTKAMQWMAKHAFCDPVRLLIGNSTCVNLKGKLLSEYLREIAPDPCPKVITTTSSAAKTGMTTTFFSTTVKPGFHCECQCQSD